MILECIASFSISEDSEIEEAALFGAFSAITIIGADGISDILRVKISLDSQ